MTCFRILIADDEVPFTELVTKRLIRQGYQVAAFNSPVEALQAAGKQNFDAALFDIRMPEMDGMELLAKVKEIQPAVEVVMLTGYSDVETAITAMKKGAYDYLTKPVQPAKLELTLQKAVEKSRLIQKTLGLAAAQKRQDQEKPMLGDSPAMRWLVDLIQRVTDSDSHVLILGESGTGKELVARSLHFWSKRADHPFIPVNVSTLSAQLAESELFGHVKGSFTGAHCAKQGLVELARNGTLFLDEIGELDLALQVKLLRFLETGEFRRVGDTETRHVQVRIVTATNRNMAEMVATGQFRKDLYYRLNVVAIPVPALRERQEDIPLLTRHFLSLHAHKEPKILSPEALNALMKYDFPGNVRELANMIERSSLLSRGAVIEKSDLFCTWDRSVDDWKLDTMEREHISKVLETVNWDKIRAAQILDIALRTLYRKIERYELTRIQNDKAT